MTAVDTPKTTRVSVALMKSDMSDATIFTLRDRPDGDRFHIIDDGTYWKVEAEDEIRIDMAAVSDEVGREVSLGEWLVTMITFVGRAAPGGDYFRVTSKLPDLDDAE